MSIGLLAGIALGYALALFLLAWRAEWQPARTVRLHRFTYPLALAIYCTSWTFFGAVGSAFDNGWAYLPIYLGPALLFLFGAQWLSRLVSLSQAEGATSLSDFVSARFSRHPWVAATITILMLAGIIPYLALQLRSIGATLGHLSGGRQDSVLGTMVAAAILALFAIAFGTRRFDAASRNDGLLVAVAAESLIKLAAFVAIGVFAVLLFAGLPPAQQSAGLDELANLFAPMSISGDFVVITLLSAAAMLCLPRQFHIGVIEARAPADPVAARWPFIAYLAIVAAVVLPITLAALATGYAGRGDLIVVDLPLAQGGTAVALIAFIGGFSAATAMVVVETIALATMVSNDLVAPLLLRSGRFASVRDAGRLMLAIRRMVIGLLLAIAVLFTSAMAAGAQLAAIGLIAFAAMAQVAPAMLLAVAGGQRQPQPLIAGVSAGGIVWAYTLLLPAIAPDWAAGMAGRWLDPQALFGLTGLSVITHGTLFSLGANLLVHGGLAALRMRPRLAIDGRAAPAAGQDGGRRALRDLVSRFVGTDRAEAVLGNDDDRPVDPLTARNAERLLVEVVGAASARALMASALSGSALTLAEVARLLDSGGASLQFSRELLAATLEHIDPGVSVIDRDLNLVAWNSRYLDLFDYPPGMVRVGAPVADLIRHNAMRGECGPGEVEAHVERRLVYMRRGSPHSFERVRPNGRVIKTVGGAMPGGGYVMCFTDVTAEAEAREAVEAARLTLERRVEDRTRQLTSANAALAAATAEKTRFLAAASHDLLQPLHAARLLCAAADRQVEDGVRPVIGNIARAIEAADETLRTLLDISKLDSGGITPTLENVPLDPLLADLAANFRPLVTERGLALCVVPTSIIVRTDRVLLRSIVQNFLSNAVRYTKSGGIVVGVRRRGTGMADICVYDSGPGIARSDIARLFREFERGRATTEAGVGLGLAIVERTARLLGLGTIVHSEPGRGSCFGVRIAIHATNGTAPQPAPPPPLTPLATLSSPHHPRLLVVDDDPAILAAMQQWGGGLGLNVTTFSCADAVLADSPPYDAALIDLNIGPGLDGLHLAERLRAAHPTARLALISADRSAEISARAARLAIPVFPKPVDPARIEAWLLA